MITTITFDQLLTEFRSKNPELAGLIISKSFNKVDISYLIEFIEFKNLPIKWVAHEWWAKIERGVHIPPEEFFGGWIPGWATKPGPYYIITMSSYSNDKVFVVPGSELLEFHNNYANYSTDYIKSLQGPGDYIAYDVSTSEVYLLHHEGYSTNFNLTAMG